MHTVSTVFRDPTPNGLVNQRFIIGLIRLSDACTFTAAEKQELFNLLILIGHKLVSVYGHYQDFLKEEERLIGECKTNPITKDQRVVRLDPSQMLFFEFDEFLVQVKSSLDHLVKIPLVALGRGRWNLRTFGSKGNEVIKALKNNVPREKKPLARGVIKMVEDNQQWLESTINARDKINHFVDGGINFDHFLVAATQDGENVTLRVPMWSPDMSVRAFMAAIWENLFKFCEDFTAGSLGFRIKDGVAFFRGPSSSLDTVRSPWVATTQEIMDQSVAKPGWSRVE